MYFTQYPGRPTRLRADDAAPGKRVLIVTKEGQMRPMTITGKTPKRIELEDGSLFFLPIDSTSYYPFGSPPHPGELYALPGDLDADQLEREYAQWKSDFDQREAEHHQRQTLSKQIREFGRRLSMDHSLSMESPATLAQLLANLQNAVSGVPA